MKIYGHMTINNTSRLGSHSI